MNKYHRMELNKEYMYLLCKKVFELDLNIKHRHYQLNIFYIQQSMRHKQMHRHLALNRLYIEYIVKQHHIFHITKFDNQNMHHLQDLVFKLLHYKGELQHKHWVHYNLNKKLPDIKHKHYPFH